MAVYGTVAELELLLGQDATVDETGILEDILERVSRQIDQHCNRPDGFIALETAQARTFVGSGRTYQVLGDFTSITLVEVKQSVTDSDYEAWNTADWIPFAGSFKIPNFNPLATANPKPYQSIMTDPAGDKSGDVFTSGQLGGRSRNDILFNSTWTYDPPNGRGPAAPTVRVTATWGYATVVPPPINQACIIESARYWKRGEGAWSEALANGEFSSLRFRGLDEATETILKRGRYIRATVWG